MHSTLPAPDAPRGTAVVTGASAGIGRVFADRLAARGHDLLLVARNAERLETVAGELAGRYGIRATTLTADLSRDDDVGRLAERLASLPAVDVLVNNAGFGTTGRLAEADPIQQEAMVRLHVLAPMRLARAALPAMLARRAGAIVNVSSVAGFVFSSGNVNYCATKAYLTTFSEGLGAELRGTGVQVQALCPGFTRSEFHERMKIGVGHIPDWLWLSADEVVDASLSQLERRGPIVCVPKLRWRMGVGVLKLVPRGLMLRVMAKRGYRWGAAEGA